MNPELPRAPVKATPSFDLFSPPVILGVTFALLFGVGIIDVQLYDDRSRLRAVLLFYRGLSIQPIVYLVLSYACFVVGYFLTPTGAVDRVRPSQRQWNPHRASIVTTATFIGTFSVLVLYILRVGYGRLEGPGSEALANLSLLGELSVIPYGFALVRDAHRRSGAPDAHMSQWDRRFLWWVMLPAQLLVSILIGVRSRAVMVVLMALTAYHYGHRRLKARTFVGVGVVLLFVALPVLEYIRSDDLVLMLPEESSSYSATAWQSVAGRTSSVETFTIIYENVDRVPEPDPIHWALITGLVPRFLWPGKPISTFAERLTFWAVGRQNLGWVGPTLPGELILMLGYAGGLAFMVFLGVLWRIFMQISRVHEKGAWLALYVIILRTLLMVEVGFVIPYGVLTRFVVVTVLLLLVTTVPVGRQVTQRRPALARAPAFRQTPAGRTAGA